MAQPTSRTGYDQHLVALEEVLQVLREQTQPDALIETTINFLQAQFDYSLIWLALYDKNEHALLGKGGITPKGDVNTLRQKFTLFPGDLLDQVLVQQRPASVPDLREESRAGEWRKVAQKFEVQGTLIYPIRHREDCIGLVLLGSQLWGGALRAEELSRLSMLLGGLGSALAQIATVKQQPAKHPNEPLLALLAQVGSLPTLQERLLAVVLETQKFIAPTRTSVYWFEPERRCFWRRAVNAAKTTSREAQSQTTIEIAVQDIAGFYQALASRQIVSIGDAQSAVATNVPLRLMQQIKAQSLLAAPILSEGQLLGFLAVDGNEIRLWQDQEKIYLQAAAQLIALVAPLEKVEQAIQQTQTEQALLSGLTHAIYTDQDWKETLKQAAEQLCQQLQVERVFLLLHDPDTGRFSICFQNQLLKHRPLNEHLQPLSDLDWQMLERTNGAIAIENLLEDLRLLTWRERLLELGVRSLLACNTFLGRALEGVLLVCHSANRTWTAQEQHVIEAVAQQVGLILHQWQLQRQTEQQQRVYASVQQGLNSIQKTQNIERLEQTALQDVMQVLQVPLAVLVTWMPGQTRGCLVTPIASNPKFAVNSEATIEINKDALIQSALQKSLERQDGKPDSRLLQLTSRDLTPETRAWLNGIEIGQIMAVALQTDPEYEPSGVLLVADTVDRAWSPLQLSALMTLIDHLAWAHRSIALTQILNQGNQTLESLNWYKQHCLEDLHSQIATCSYYLSTWIRQKGSVDQTIERVTRQLQSLQAGLASLTSREAWKLQLGQETIVLATLIKRSLERVDPLIKQRQIWIQVHNHGNLTLSGDVVKIDLILYELLRAACDRASVGGRIDIWCQVLNRQWVELSITDDGEIDPRLLIDLHHQEHLDLLAPSTLDQPPGRHLKVCQRVVQQLGGQMDMFKLEDNRMLSRLMLPLTPLGQTQPSTMGMGL
ncbi:MAG: GAF domain-containing protein [Aphanocapsa sp. GSE-SYN-MK-11-07L]|jgi:GAF domain-containing protein|nr:GAF domain-containing protein [Aphanocapsa sp. GSE-SYN-MK-11-07L]